MNNKPVNNDLLLGDFYSFLFEIFGLYKSLKNSYSDRANNTEDLNDYVKNNFWYLYCLWIHLELAFKPSFSNYLIDVLKIYLEYNPHIKKIKSNPEMTFVNDTERVVKPNNDILEIMKNDHRLLNHIVEETKVYHYTSVDALKSIIDSHELWFSNYSEHTNDDFEGKYLERYVENFYPDKVKVCSEIKQKQDVFGFCLSLQCDDAAQWERYGDKQKGVCLVLNLKDIGKYLFDDNAAAQGSFFMFPIKYASFSEIENRNNSAEFAVANLNDHGDFLFNRLRYTFKDKSFESEKEYRLFFCCDKKQKSIEGLSNVTISDDYLKIEISKKYFSSVIHKVILGHSISNADLSEVKVKLDNEKIEYTSSLCPLIDKKTGD